MKDIDLKKESAQSIGNRGNTKKDRRHRQASSTSEGYEDVKLRLGEVDNIMDDWEELQSEREMVLCGKMDV